MRLINKRSLVFIIMSAIFFTISSYAQAAPTITVGYESQNIDASRHAGETITIPITVDNPEHLIGASFMLEYHSDLTVNIRSGFFPVLQLDQQQIEQPFYENEQASASSTVKRVAGMRLSPATANATHTLFELTINLGSVGGAARQFPIRILPIELADGSEVDLLYGVRTDTNGTTMITSELSSASYSGYVNDGLIEFSPESSTVTTLPTVTTTRAVSTTTIFNPPSNVTTVANNTNWEDFFNFGGDGDGGNGETPTTTVPESTTTSTSTTTTSTTSVHTTTTSTETNTTTTTSSIPDTTTSTSSVVDTTTSTTTVPTNYAPEPPYIVEPSANIDSLELPITIRTTNFIDAESDSHQKTRWQITKEQKIFHEDYILCDEISDEFLTRWTVPNLTFSRFDKKADVYYVRAQFFDGKNWSAFSDWQAFTISSQLPVFIGGIEQEDVIPDNTEIRLPEEFIDANGAPANTDTIKVFKAQVDGAGIQIGIKTDNCRINKCRSLSLESSVISADPSNLPAMPFGMISFVLSVDNPGDTGKVTLHFSEKIPEGAQWWKYDANLGGFYDYELSTFENVVEISEDRKSMTIWVKDGDYGDEYQEPDSMIYDPGAVAVTSAAGDENNNDDDDNGEDDNGGGGGGGSCFIQNLLKDNF